jgi:hypothetical protein
MNYNATSQQSNLTGPFAKEIGRNRKGSAPKSFFV